MDSSLELLEVPAHLIHPANLPARRQAAQPRSDSKGPELWTRQDDLERVA